MKFYEPHLWGAIQRLKEIQDCFETQPPHVAMKGLIDAFECEDEAHKQSIIELLNYIEATYHRLHHTNPHQPNLEIWIQMLNLMALSSSELDRVMKEENKLAIITVHQSKGLEFDHVIIPFMSQGMFPLDFDGINQEEECRLFYVAMTRAKQSLLLTRHMKETSSSRRVKERSQFISFLYS